MRARLSHCARKARARAIWPQAALVAALLAGPAPADPVRQPPSAKPAGAVVRTPGRLPVLAPEAIRRMTLPEVDAELRRRGWADRKDSMAEVSEMDRLMLQQLMERKNQLESTVDN